MAIEQTAELETALQQAAERHASDLYLLPGEPVSFRVKGEMVRGEGPVLSGEDTRRIALAAVGAERLAALRGQAGRLVTSCGGAGMASGHMCIASSRGEYTIVIPLMTARPLSVERLAVPVSVVEAAGSANGLMLFSGRPGSGKTTTLYSVVDHLNQNRPVHICTVEDPIGFFLTPKRALVQQREVGVDVPDTLAGIAAAMRQDLDVLMVGELKTVDEVQACVTAADTGHLVMTQLHAPTPAGAIERLVEIQPPENAAMFRRSLARILRCVVAQVLLPRADERGLVAAYGVLIPDEPMRQAIAAGRDLFDRPQPLPAGCQDLAEHIRSLQRQGIVTEAAAERALQMLGNEA